MLEASAEEDSGSGPGPGRPPLAQKAPSEDSGSGPGLGRPPLAQKAPSEDSGSGPGPGRPPLAQKALSEAFCSLRYRDTSLLVWQQQQQQVAPPASYLSRSQSAWYSSYGNQAVLVRDHRVLQEVQARSRICSLM